MKTYHIMFGILCDSWPHKPLCDPCQHFFPAHVPRRWVNMAWFHDLSSFLPINDKTDLQIHNSYQCINFKLRSTNIPPVHLTSCNTTLHFCPLIVLLFVLCSSCQFCCIFWIYSFGNVQIGLLHQIQCQILHHPSNFHSPWVSPASSLWLLLSPSSCWHLCLDVGVTSVFILNYNRLCVVIWS